MKYLLVIFIAALLCLPFTSNAFAWEPPEECADEDREIPGNRTTPCKLVVPELTEIEYRVRLDYPECIEELVFHMPGMGVPNVEKFHSMRIIGSDGKSELDKGNELYFYRVNHEFGNGYISFVNSEPYTLNSRIGSESKFSNPYQEMSYVALRFRIRGLEQSDGFYRYTIYSNILPRPRTDSKVSLVNSCLSLLIQEKEDREHAERLKQEEAAKEAELAAQREAELKAEQQAKREAQIQARLAKIELQTVLENKLTAANTELVRTQTLAAQLEHEKVIGEILREIVSIRLTGKEDRARITNEYLTSVEASIASFDEETAKIEARIQEYVDFNEKLFASIEQYQAGIGSRVDAVRESVLEQQQRIAQIEQEARDLAEEIEELPVPVEESEGE